MLVQRLFTLEGHVFGLIGGGRARKSGVTMSSTPRTLIRLVVNSSTTEYLHSVPLRDGKGILYVT